MSVHDINQKFADEKGAKMLRGYDGYDNYFLLGTFPEFGAMLAMRARNGSAGKKGTKVGFKLRLMPMLGAEHGNWQAACPGLVWSATNDERRSACFGIGLAAWTREEVNLAVKDVDYPQLVDNWLTAMGLTWDDKQRELLPAYLEEAENALFTDDFGEGVATLDIEGRTAHEARMILPEDQIYYGSAPATDPADDLLSEDTSEEAEDDFPED